MGEMMGRDPTKNPDDAKLRELILFIAQRSADDERFGSVKLNKLLFFSDFTAFQRLGTSITGHVYQRLDKGPAPKKFIPIKNAMVEKRELAMASRDFHGRPQKVPIALRNPNLKLFSAEEIAIVTEVLEALWRKNAKGISTLSHRFAGWELANDGEPIPYESALVQIATPRKRDIKKALEMGEELIALSKEFPRSDADD